MAEPSPLVSTQWLGERLGKPGVAIIDASWRMPGAGASVDDYRERHIPGAVFFDIDGIADKSVDLPHMAPTRGDFERAVGELGVSPDDFVIVYDDQGIFSAARVWWTFRLMGHDQVAVLDGGLKKWIAEERQVTNEPSEATLAIYRAAPTTNLAANVDDIRAAIKSGEPKIVDARSRPRFRGKAPEPRAGLRSGGMPGAKNVPFETLLNDEGTLKSQDEINAIFNAIGVTKDTLAITTCGSGVTAAVLALALEVAGRTDWRLYDGSWAEWGMETNDPGLFPVVSPS
ncbi:MAG: 3-mercaptopyruvate sulfurtransferase [Marinicaulis sp.]|nr:3-mercaptopyruvate sulfurtransferase [Marinicaulis sp.]